MRPPVEQTLVAHGSNQPGLRVADGLAMVDQGEEGLLEDVFRILWRDAVALKLRFEARPDLLQEDVERSIGLLMVQGAHLTRKLLNSGYTTTMLEAKSSSSLHSPGPVGSAASRCRPSAGPRRSRSLAECLRQARSAPRAGP